MPTVPRHRGRHGRPEQRIRDSGDGPARKCLFQPQNIPHLKRLGLRTGVYRFERGADFEGSSARSIAVLL
jgi:hypothetical protein